MELLKREKTILCVDDDKPTVHWIEKVILSLNSSKHLTILKAHDAKSALKIIATNKPDIVLSDVFMPDISGYDLCRKAREKGFNSVIILMSAYEAEKDNAINAKDAGADGFLSKPLKRGELLFLVNFVLRQVSLNNTITRKNVQLEDSLKNLKSVHLEVASLNQELEDDKRRLNNSLNEMVGLNSQLESKNLQISSMNMELMKRFDATVNLLSNIIEINRSKDRGHSERVAETATFIANKMGLDADLVETIRVGARLHELGIVSLPVEETIDEVMDESKSRKFTRHPLVGEMLLKGFPGFERVADIIRHLHENVNGTGIPDGLSGDQIPIGSRIISISSFYDHSVLASPNSTSEEVLEEVSKVCGEFFDEKVFVLLEDFVLSKQTVDEDSYECNVFSLSPGMELASDIYSESGINLLRKGTVIEDDMLAKVLKFNNVDPVTGTIRIKRT